MEEKRVCDYFVVIGLPENPLPLEQYSNEAILKPSHKQDPITDIVVIIKSIGENVPKGFTCIERTPTGYSADLNHGSLRSPEINICYKRGRHKPPLTDIGVLYEGKELVMVGCDVVYLTPQGRPANVNNSNSSRTYITYRRADESAASDTLAVTEICVILTNKSETPPHAFCQILKNLNKGMVGSDVYLCYKKSMVKSNFIAYNAGILGKYPLENYADFPLPETVAMFGLPMGATIECWSSKSQHPLPVFSTFVLTGHSIDRVYGAAITFYEEYQSDKLTDLQKRLLGFRGSRLIPTYQTVHVNKSICILSHWPFFGAFRKFLSFLYRISIVGPHTIPIERYISHFMNEVPFPSPQRPRILVRLNQEALSLSQPEETPLPKSGASFIALLQSLGPEKCLDVLLFLLHEQKLLIHSLRPALMTSVVEAISMIIFPLHWQCPYIPLCPLGLSGVLNAPCPFIVGVDSRYFDLYDPPLDVICVDLDTTTITQPVDRKVLNFKMLPKRPAKVLKNRLSDLYDILCEMNSDASTPEASLDMDIEIEDHDFRHQRTELLMNIEIQEAFLRFMACIIKGYKQMLLPITKAPTLSATDAFSLFDMEGFLRSRDKNYQKFFVQMMKTQTFIRFIEERSFVSEKDASLAFFDECCDKVDENSCEPRLIELDDAYKSEHTVLITPPDTEGLPIGTKYSYNGFPELKPELFLQKAKPRLLSGSKKGISPGSPMAKRTKQEIKLAQRLAQQHVTSPELWAKCLLAHCYSLWFIHLPSFVSSMNSKSKALHIAYDVLVRMQNSPLESPDEVCYRVLMQLCGLYQQPALAVKVLFEMKRHGIQPNAVTYGFYNKAVLESTWPSTTSNAYCMWRKLRNVVLGVAQFRWNLRRRSTITLTEVDTRSCGIESWLEDSFVNDHISRPSSKRTEFVNDLVPVTANEANQLSGTVSDQGYNSITREEAQQISEAMVSRANRRTPEVIAAVQVDGSTPEAMASRFDPVSSEAMVSQVDGSASANNHGKTTILKKVDPPAIKQGADQKFAVDAAGKRCLTMAEFQPLDPPKDEFRARLGSIVRTSLSSMGSSGSVATLKGSTLGNIAGILMTGSPSLDNEMFDQSLSSNASIRKRHRSAGDHNIPVIHRRSRHRSGDTRVSFHPGLGPTKADVNENSESRLLRDEQFGDDMKRIPQLATGENGTASRGSRTNVEILPSMCRSAKNPTPASSEEFCITSFEEQKTPTPLGAIAVINSLDRTPVTQNDPLGLFVDVSSATLSDVAGSELTPASENISNIKVFDLMDLNLELSTDHHRMESSDTCPLTDLLIDFDGDNDKGRDHKWSLPSTIEIERAKERHRLHTISECSVGSAGTFQSRQQTLSESSESSAVSGDWVEKQAASHAVSRPQSIVERPRNESGLGVCSPSSGGERFVLTTPSGNRPDMVSSPRNIQASVQDTVTSPQKLQTLNTMTRSDSFSDVVKHAASVMASKIIEMKQTISTAKLSSSLPKTFDMEKPLSLSPEEYMAARQRRRYSEAAVDALSSQKCNVLNDLDQYMVAAKGLLLSKDQTSNFPPLALKQKVIQLKDMCPLRESLVGCPLPVSLLNCVVEVEMSTLSRCFVCSSLLYDEEIMAGWSADDSNLNTSCPFCKSGILVPFLHIYIKDGRLPLLTTPRRSSESMQCLQSLLTPGVKLPTRSTFNLSSSNAQGRIESMLLEDSKSDSTDSGTCNGSPLKMDTTNNLIDFSPAHKPETPIYSDGIHVKKVCERRRSLSECVSSSQDGAVHLVSKNENQENTVFLDSDDEVSASTLEPISIPYLSPLVLRKELETIVDHDGDSCLGKSEFVDEHPIIFWNLIWYFKRLDVPSHLPGAILTARSINKDQELAHNASWNVDSRYVVIKPCWDNRRLHDEAGQPMYVLWQNPEQSRMVNALVTEHRAFSPSVMCHIIDSIRCNDLITPMKLVLKERNRLSPGKGHHRSMYREILYLVMIACGRSDIDHDAFDREYLRAYKELPKKDQARLLPCDKPALESVTCCRKFFGELIF